MQRTLVVMFAFMLIGVSLMAYVMVVTPAAAVTTPECCWPPKTADIVNIDVYNETIAQDSNYALYTVPQGKTFVITYFEIRYQSGGSVDLVDLTSGATKRNFRLNSGWSDVRVCGTDDASCSWGGPFIGPAVGYKFSEQHCVALCDSNSNGPTTVDVNLVGYLTTR